MVLTELLKVALEKNVTETTLLLVLDTLDALPIGIDNLRQSALVPALTQIAEKHASIRATAMRMTRRWAAAEAAETESAAAAAQARAKPKPSRAKVGG
jgi:hypothetical protein